MKRTAQAGCGLVLADALGERLADAQPIGTPPAPQKRPRECMFYEKIGRGNVRCLLCPHHCRVREGQRGDCGVRENQNGTYRTLVYNRYCSFNIDPIEKKPFYHYLPGTTAASVATAGCNFTCKFCQNWQISQSLPEEVRHRPLTTAGLVARAVERHVPTIAYTYSEPTVFYEYMHDTAKLGRTRGVGSVIVSNGYMCEDATRRLLNHLTAVKVDLKAFTEKFYQDVCGGHLQPVLDNLQVIHSTGIHLELVVLLIPTLNDGKDEIRKMCEWVVEKLGVDVPIHFSRFHPTYQMKNLPRTPVKTLEMAREVAVEAGVRYAYVGNVAFHAYGHTYCHACKTKVIERVGYRVENNLGEDGKCPKCGAAIPGVWSQKQALAFKPN